MTAELLWVLTLLFIAIFLFIRNGPGMGVVAIIMLVALPLSDILTVPAALTGFSAAGLGAVMSSTSVVAIFIPIVLSIAIRLDTPARRLMMPLSFAVSFAATGPLQQTQTQRDWFTMPAKGIAWATGGRTA